MLNNSLCDALHNMVRATGEIMCPTKLMSFFFSKTKQMRFSLIYRVIDKCKSLFTRCSKKKEFVYSFCLIQNIAKLL